MILGKIESLYGTQKQKRYKVVKIVDYVFDFMLYCDAFVPVCVCSSFSSVLVLNRNTFSLCPQQLPVTYLNNNTSKESLHTKLQNMRAIPRYQDP